MKLSQIVKIYRDGLSLTLEQVSDGANLSKAFLSRIEKGDFDNKNISLDSIIRLAKGLNIKVKEILDDLRIIEQEEPTSLKIYLRKKYEIGDERDTRLIEDLINNIQRK